MKFSTRVLGISLLLVLVLTIFPITAGARGFSNITGTQPEQQQRHGFDLGKPSAAEPLVPGATRSSRSSQHRSPNRRRSSVRRYSSQKKYASGRKNSRNTRRQGYKKAARAKETREETTVILSETEPPRHVFISKITPSSSGTSAKQKDPMQTPKARRVADFLMMGIAGFSILAALLYVFTAHRSK